LLGAFNSSDTPAHAEQPQLVDADTLPSAQEAEKAEEQRGKSSSLLEQVFGLDDLEEEKPSKSKSKSDGKRSSPPSTSALPTAQPPSSDVADEFLRGSQPATEKVELEETDQATGTQPDPSWQTQDGLSPPEPATEPAPQKDLLGDNPYK
jgi:hypothetical protein